MDRTLIVKHTKDRHGVPLACVHNLPGDGAEFSAAQLRQIAVTLNTIADDCDQGIGLDFAKTCVYDMEQLEQRHPFEENPFVAYRAEICGGYSTGQRLAALTLHLYNGAAHRMRLDNLLSNADERHTRIALEMIAWYAKHGENCIDFMDLARYLLEREAA